MDRLEHDQSQPAPGLKGSLRVWILGAGGSEVRSGEIVACTQIDETTSHLTIAPASGQGGRFELGVALPCGVRSCLELGRRVQTRVDHEVIGNHPVPNASIVDLDNRELLLALSGKAAPAYAPGWTIERGPEAERGRSIDYWIRFEHRERQAFVRGNEWRVLEVGAGTWGVSGHGRGYDPSKPLTPGASDYDWFELIRLG